MDVWMEESESLDLLRRMFPHGAGGPDVMRSLCPEGWRRSPLRLAFHPSEERLWEEHVRFHENLNRLRRDGDSPDPPPDREAFLRERRSQPASPDKPDDREVAHLVGLCLWDILSDNHDLVCPDGQTRHMGSFRSVGGLLYDFIDRDPDTPRRDIDVSNWREWDMGYMDYFMGTIYVGGRTDLSPVYRLIFQRLREQGYEWNYTFPRLHAIRFSKPDSDKPDPAAYDPSASFAREQELAKEEADHDRLQKKLEDLHREALEQAKQDPPPTTVTAFRDVYGRWPRGWPPW